MSEFPESFFSLETDAPFTHCCGCNCELLQSAQMYMVQKNFDRGECVMEYALCNNCKEKLDKQISAKSKESLFDFLFDHAEMVEAPESYTANEAIKQIEECLTCGKERSACRSYTYSGLFLGSILIPGPMPMMICGTCQEKITEGLSEETKDVRDKFFAENFPGPPSEMDLPTRGKPMII